MRYKVLKTTMGRKYRVPMSDQEVAERAMYRMAVAILPFVGSALMFWLWVKAV